jgi:protein ImuB
MKRVVCIRIPGAHLAVFLRGKPERQSAPIVILDARGRVLCASRTARLAGVQTGMTRPQVETIRPGTQFADIDHDRETREWQRLAGVLGRFSPSVEIAPEPGVFYLDGHGMGRLYGTTRDYLSHIRFTLQGEGYHTRVAIAGSRFAARAATLLGDVYEVLPGRDKAALAGLPLTVLPLSPSLAEACAALGIQTLGMFSALPSEQLEARFGREGIEAARLARGDDPSPNRPHQFEQLVAVDLELDGPVEQSEAIRLILANLSDRLVQRLADRGLACEEARLHLVLDDRSSETHLLKPAAPTLSARLLAELAQLHIDANPFAAPLIKARLEAAHTSPAAPEQQPLFARASDPERAQIALARLRGLLGDDAVLVPRHVATYRPEKRIQWAPYAETQTPSTRRPGKSSRSTTSSGSASASKNPAKNPATASSTAQSSPSTAPPPPPDFLSGEGLRLCTPPLPIAVRIDSLERPVWAQSAWAWGKLSAAQGPERIGGEWWSDPYERDYYRVDWESGGCAWIYLDRLQGGWFIHGLYD